MRIIKNGVKVKIREDLEVDNYYNDMFFAENMKGYRGQELEIESRHYRREHSDYSYELKGASGWFFVNEMFDMSLLSDDDFVDSENICPICGEIMTDDNKTYIEHEDIYVCDDCLDNNYTYCEDCCEYYRNEDCYEVENDRMVCYRCYEHYVECARCGRMVYEDDAYYSEYHDCYYCDNCEDYARGNEMIYDYHEFQDWRFYKGSEEVTPPFYIGHELEVENPRGDSDCIQDIYDNLNCICAHDGSLDSGYEIISHPQSYKWYKENKDKYKNILNELIQNGYTSHNAGTCGLHFHVTRPFYNEINELRPWASEEDNKKHRELVEKQGEIIDRIILIMETFKEEIIKFSRRTPEQMHWCRFLSDARNSGNEIKSLYFIKKHKDSCDRYMALNLENSATIEFRIFRGTLKYETFMASLELVNNIVTLCSDLSIKVEDITWDKLIDSDFARVYCDENNIYSNKVVVDNSSEDIAKERKQKAKAITIGNLMIKLYNMALDDLRDIRQLNINNGNAIRNSLCNNSSANGVIRDLSSKIDDIVRELNHTMVNYELIKDIVTSTFRYVNIDWQKDKYKSIKQKLQKLVK